MNKDDIKKYIDSLKKRYNVRVYTPFTYFKGLDNKKDIQSRFMDIIRGSSDPNAYTPFQTDTRKPTKQSRYTLAFYQMYGSHASSIAQKSAVSGVPVSILQKVFQKGKAAWRTGHRVGATPDQWGYARVHSFIMLGCTAFASDFPLLRDALDAMTDRQKRSFLCKPIMCPKATLEKAYFTKRGAEKIINEWMHTYCPRGTNDSP